MGQRADELGGPGGRNNVSRVRVSSSESSQTSGQREGSVQPSDIEQTRAEMSETIEAIQEQLVPERLSEEAKDTVAEAIDNALQQIKAALPEVSAQASGTAERVLDHAIEDLRAVLPELSDQASDAAVKIVDNAIMQLKAAVQELTGDAKAAVRDATVGRIERVASNTGASANEMRSSMMTTIRENPVPAALAGIGIGWLLINRSGSSSSAGQQTGSSVSSQANQAVGQAQQTVGQAAGSAQQAAGQVAGQAQQAAGQVAGQAQQAAEQVQQTTGQVVDQVQETASQVAEQVQQHAQQARGRLEQMVMENPVPIGALALAIGGAVGLAVPGTQREQQLMGETRDRVVERVAETVQETAQDTMEKVQRVAEEAGEAVEKEARYQGLAPDQGQS